MPATMVGSAKGRSITAFTSALARKLSRTSTHAVTVPRTALIRTTTRAVPSVSLRADTASGLETTCQNEWAPSFFDSQTSAAIGRTTTIVKKVEMTPTDAAVLARPPAPTLGDLRAAAAATLLMGGTSDRLLDRDHAARVRVEPNVVHLPPAAEEAIVDVEGRTGVVPLAPGGEARTGGLQDRPDRGPVAVGREHSLLLGEVAVRDKCLRRGGRALERHHR